MTVVRPAAEEDEGIPDPDVLAYRLIARESPLDRAILHELIGRPKRYADLKPLLGEKADNNLTVALKRLQEWGLIERRTDARREPVVHSYELTPLGIQVILAIPAIQPIHESMARFERARAKMTLVDLHGKLQVGTAQRERAERGVSLTQTVANALAEYLARTEGTAFDQASPDGGRAEPKLEEYVEKKGGRRGART